MPSQRLAMVPAPALGSGSCHFRQSALSLYTFSMLCLYGALIRHREAAPLAIGLCSCHSLPP